MEVGGFPSLIIYITKAIILWTWVSFTFKIMLLQLEKTDIAQLPTYNGLLQDMLFKILLFVSMNLFLTGCTTTWLQLGCTIYWQSYFMN